MPGNMLPHILRYFRAEKSASLWMVLVGVVAIALALWLWWRGGSIRGMAVTLGLVAATQLIVGGTVYTRTDGQIDRLTEQYYSDREAYATGETARMESVVSRFGLYRVIEISLVVVGILMIVGFRSRRALVAAGIGLVIQSGALFIFDWYGLQRAEAYLTALRRLA